MAVPKRRLSRSNTRSRRSRWKATPVPLTPVRTPDGRVVEAPRRLARSIERGLVDPT